MNARRDLKKGILWFVGIAAAAAFYALGEGWLILMVRMFGFWGGAAIITLVTLLFSWLVIYVASGFRNIGRLGEWIKKREEALSSRAKAAIDGSKALAVANTAVLIGPASAALLMMMLGIRRNNVYFYSIFCSLLGAVTRAGFYSGIFWGIGKAAGR